MINISKPDPDKTTSFEFDGPEGKGVVEIEEGSYGAYIWVNGKCLALVDLFYLSDAGQDIKEPHPALVFYEPDTHEDALGGVHWFHDEIEVYVERRDLVLTTDMVGRTLTYKRDWEDDMGECEPGIGSSDGFSRAINPYIKDDYPPERDGAW